MTEIKDFVETYGEALILRWLAAGETAYLKRKAKAAKPKKVDLNQLLSQFTPEQVDQLCRSVK